MRSAGRSPRPLVCAIAPVRKGLRHLRERPCQVYGGNPRGGASDRAVTRPAEIVPTPRSDPRAHTSTSSGTPRLGANIFEGEPPVSRRRVLLRGARPGLYPHRGGPQALGTAVSIGTRVLAALGWWSRGVLDPRGSRAGPETELRDWTGGWSPSLGRQSCAAGRPPSTLRAPFSGTGASLGWRIAARAPVPRGQDTSAQRGTAPVRPTSSGARRRAAPGNVVTLFPTTLCGGRPHRAPPALMRWPAPPSRGPPSLSPPPSALRAGSLVSADEQETPYKLDPTRGFSRPNGSRLAASARP